MPIAWKSSIACTCTAQLCAAASRSAACCVASACAARQRSTRPAARQVAVDEVVRRGLVGDEVGPDAAASRADELGQDFGGVAEQADRHRLLLARVALDARQRVVEVVRLLVEVARAQAEVDARLLAFDVQRARRRRSVAASGCAPPMPPRPAVRIQRARQVAAVVLAARLDEGLVGALHDALRADVDPRAGRHLAVHHQALAVELVEVLPRRPLRHQVGVGDQHARRIGVRAEHADRLARLHQQRLVLASARAALPGSRRSSPSCAPPCRCRRRPPARRGSRPPRDRGCSGSSGRPPRSASSCSSAGAARRAHGCGLGERRWVGQVGHGALVAFGKMATLVV